MIEHFRIHGDNIVECDRTLQIIVDSYEREATYLASEIYRPIYTMRISYNLTFHIELLPGHGRWGFDVATLLMDKGGQLRESADSYVTKVEDGNETLLFAIEYCSALPAGNNAWQRSGRAFSSVMAGVPYLYYSELGGVELDSNRNVKSPRFPNPLVPFSYLKASQKFKSICLPVHLPHPSISKTLHAKFRDVFGNEEAHKIVRGIMIGENYDEVVNNLIGKDLKLVEILSNGRRKHDTLYDSQWKAFLKAHDSAKWLIDNADDMIWQKKFSEKINVSKSFIKLRDRMLNFGCTNIGAKDFPICLVPSEKLNDFRTLLTSNYKKLDIKLSDKPLAIVWITGFKPQGEDSRPDRGLCPLARMVLGDNANILAIVYGPAKKAMWEMFQNSPNELAKENGLWQSIMAIADYVLVDSATCDEKIFIATNRKSKRSTNAISFASNPELNEFTEHDTDTAIHQIFADHRGLGIYECLCNPPGGDWSGISFFLKRSEYRWTSLPRVSQVGGKRPDHLIQIVEKEKITFFVIESKKNATDLEANIGENLKTYMGDLFCTLPTARQTNMSDWRLFDQKTLELPDYKVISIGAFEYKDGKNVSAIMRSKGLDAVFAFEFGRGTTLHIWDKSGIVADIVKKTWTLVYRLKIEIH